MKGTKTLRVALLLGALALSLTACGDEDGGDGNRGAGSPAAAEEGPVHVHGLGINPKDGALFIATHTGLFRVEEGRKKAARVGESTQDTMGFTILGPDRFLGSGHPGQFDNAINPLGLIRSTDAGRSWRSVSLSGEADFHVLRSAHGRVYGFDSMNGRFLISSDGGESWDERETPTPLIDLAVDPRDRRHLVAAGQGGLQRSRDEGRSWRSSGGNLGLLAWPVSGRLYLVDGRGAVQLSRDAGGSWSDRGNIGGQPAALLADGPKELYAALPDGTIRQSRDGGASWTVRSTP